MIFPYFYILVITINGGSFIFYRYRHAESIIIISGSTWRVLIMYDL